MTEIIAHRGFMQCYPENTLGGFATAIRLGADGLETDIQQTKDNVLVLCHDKRVNRTTNGTGLIRDYTLAKLQQLDAGVTFYKRPSSDRIPTLTALLNLLNKLKFKGTLNVEIKAGLLGTEWFLADLLKQRADPYKVIVSSFDVATLTRFHKLMPQTKTALLARWQVNNAMKLAKKGVITAIHPKWWLLLSHRHLLTDGPLPARVWTVNQRSVLEWCFRHHVAAVITDNLNLALAIRRSSEK